MKKFGFSRRHLQGSLPYPTWIRKELSGIVRKSIHHLLSSSRAHVAFITFRTDHPGVVIPDGVQEHYPSIIRIFLKTGAQKKTLIKSDDVIVVSGVVFAEGLETTIAIPLSSIVSFYDRESNIIVHMGNPPIERRGNIVPIRQW